MALPSLWMWTFAMAFSLVSGLEGESCSALGSCHCTLGVDGELDLKPQDIADPKRSYSAQTFNSNKNATEWSLDTYFFHPCRDIQLGDPTNPINNCKAASLCRHTIQFKKNGTDITMSDLGNNPLGQFEDSKIIGNKNKVSLQYSKNSIVSTVILSCITDGESILQISSGDPDAPILGFYSPNACIKSIPEPTHHSLGTTLLIIFFVLALVYLLAGYCVKRFSTGARGIELIPNINFWKELPSLVRDGVVFVQNGFKPPASTSSPGPNPNPNPNSYDSI
ncbi:uncharacterized protein LOC143909071 [Arctopsyche grandis]|uniref:uncharacterized protein LOC143909071 n=1 Tax=Arctopsyche grandis TaxID=121162 RepID=UPI00406D6EAE